MFHFFEHWFPPDIKGMKHTVINSLAKKSLKAKTGIDASVIPDTFDFENQELGSIDSYSKYWRRDFEIADDDLVFLQATRVVPRKRIELSIELVAKINNPKAILVVSGHEGDERVGYLKELKKMAREKKIRFRFIADRVNSQRKIVAGKRIYTLWDCYVNSDFVTYPTAVEGFGNQFIESIYFKKPIILTPYPVYKADIAPLGFDVVEMSDEVAAVSVKKVKNLIKNSERREKMVEKNYKIARKHFSYEAVEKKLEKILTEMNI